MPIITQKVPIGEEGMKIGKNESAQSLLLIKDAKKAGLAAIDQDDNF